MKKLFSILIFLVALVNANAQPQPPGCCPEFELRQLGQITPCAGDSTCRNSAGGVAGDPLQGAVSFITACKNSASIYQVVPSLPGFTFTWVVTGGTLIGGPTGNPKTIIWGSGNQGTIQVTITNGTCTKVISRIVCLLNSPVASFTYAPTTTVCTNQPIQFTNTSTGASTIAWNFGDGSTSLMPNPLHGYSSPGVYTVLLTVTNSVMNPNNPEPRGCGCSDTATAIITVVAGNGPVITSCKKMLCPGDTANYCASGCSGPYTWTIVGGTPTSATGNCVNVIWNPSPGQQPSVTLTATGGCGPCGNTTTMQVPVLFNGMPINGPSPVCIGSTNTYSLPVLPGVFYNWTLSGGGTIQNGGNYPANFPVNNPNVVINWTTAGTYTLTCNYYNPNNPKKCSGTSTKTIVVRPRFNISGPLNPCADPALSSFYNTADFSLANWTVTGGTAGVNYNIVGSASGVSSLQVQWLIAGTYQVCALPILANINNYCNTSNTSPPICLSITVKPVPIVTIGGPPPQVCVGNLYNFTASSNLPGGTFSWSVSPSGTTAPFGTNNSSVSATFTGTGPWTLTAYHTVNNCTGSANMTINALPVPVITPGTVTGCPGGTVNLTASGPAAGGFTWTSTPYATLITGQGTANATYQLSGGAASTQVTVSNCNGPSLPATITISPVSVTITRTGFLCTGNLVLTVTPSGSNQWFFNGGVVGSGATYSVTQPGNYLVQVTLPGGCLASATFNIPPETIPVASISAMGPTNFCIPTPPNVTLQALTTPGCTYLWYRNGVSTGVTGGTYPATTVGSYYVVVTCGTCVATSNTINVTQVPCPPPPGGCNGVPNPIGTVTVTNCNPKNFSVTIINCPTATITWYFGDGQTATGANVTHTYASPGNYTVVTEVICNGCVFTKLTVVQVPLVAKFNYNIVCGVNQRTITFTNQSLSLPGWGSYTMNWSVVSTPANCATPASGTGPTFVLTVPSGCNPTVTLTINNTVGGVPCSVSTQQAFTFPTANLAITLPTGILCPGVSYTFGSNMPGMVSYAWTFPPGSTSPLANPQHSFPAIPATNNVQLIVVDGYGCSYQANRVYTMANPPAIAITPNPAKICQGGTVILTATSGFTQYQWFQNGTSLGAPTNSNTITITDNGNVAGNYTVQALSNPDNCPVKSVPVLLTYHPKPPAKINAPSVICGSSTPVNIFGVSCNPAFTPGYQYDWYQNTISGVPIFSSTSTNFLTWSVNSFANYTIIVKVTDLATGCTSLDTSCLVVQQNPTSVTIVPGGPLCQGPVHNLTATAAPAGTYTYTWQDGSQANPYAAIASGIYSVTATNQFGCSVSNSINIAPTPYVALFPQGCDTICNNDTSHYWFPIPTTTGGSPTYTITWYEGVNPIGTGTSIPKSVIIALGLGSHTITATVQLGNCTATTAILTVFVKDCPNCDCKESHWGNKTYTIDNITKPINCSPPPVIPINVKCNKTITINANYNCVDSVCNKAVTYTLVQPSGTTSGNVPLTFLTSLPGTYTVTLYGWCGNKICDSCVVKFTVKCDTCDCKGSKWGTKTLTINNAATPATCGKTYDLKCKDQVSINANYNCADSVCTSAVTYTLVQPSGTTTGNMPLTFIANLPGNYTVTLYGWCDGKICDSCVISFKVGPCDEPCCPYIKPPITVKDPSIQLSTISNPPATVVNATFPISGPPGNLFTEIRAEVISYNLFSNFNNECLSCKSYPYTWASIYQAGTVGSIPPKITMYNSTATSFNPSGNGMYQNPREVVWTGSPPFALPANINMQFLLPPASIIDCCDLTAKICVKFTFRDKNCKECEVIVCFSVSIKKK